MREQVSRLVFLSAGLAVPLRRDVAASILDLMRDAYSFRNVWISGAARDSVSLISVEQFGHMTMGSEVIITPALATGGIT
jgi:hypothetical protein